MRQNYHRPLIQASWVTGACTLLAAGLGCFASTEAQAQVDSRTRLLSQRSLTAPRKGSSVVDPTFNVAIKRLTDRGQNHGLATAEYPQLQAFSSDETKILLTTDRGREIIDLNGNTLYTGLPLKYPRWSPDEPNTLYGFNRTSGGTIYFQQLDLGTSGTWTITNVANVTNLGFTTIDAGCWEDLSKDGRYATLLDQANSKVSVLDLWTRGLRSTVRLTADVDWVAVSPSGKYLLIQYVRRGTGTNQGLIAHDASTGAFLGHVTDHYSHGDLGVDESGFDVFQTIAYTDACANGSVACTSVSPLPNAIEAGTRNHLFQMSPLIGSYTSCRNESNGGFCLHGDDNGRAGASPMAKEIWLTRQHDGAVRRLAHHRSSSCSYYIYSRPTISRSGRYVLFTSDWARPNCSDQADTYLIDLRPVLAGWAPVDDTP